MKVKIFCSGDACKLTESINNFVQDKKVIDIKYSSAWCPSKTNANGVITNGIFNDRVLIMYEEKNKGDER